MCLSSSRSLRFLQGQVSSATAAPQSVSGNLSFSQAVLTTGALTWPGRLLGSAMVGEGSRLMLLRVADWHTGREGWPEGEGEGGGGGACRGATMLHN